MPIEPRDMGLQKETPWRKMGDHRRTKWILCTRRSAVCKVDKDAHLAPHEEVEAVRRCTALNQADPAQIIDSELERVPSDMLQFFPLRGRRRAAEARYPPHLWNEFEVARSNEPRKINTEAWHNRFQNIAYKKRSIVYKLIHYLKNEQSDVERMIQELDLGRRVK
ncbi:hypothetical protein ANN_27985 [Periplaneta americana]|uniref:Uncharacterized protein n=1 Tax=Periplaneta americana TaxID=6978 RepID=A0ABQ8RUZ1_PERAM|nr:hypothetical protein ANN_27985 [Periplaneta americana]